MTQYDSAMQEVRKQQELTAQKLKDVEKPINGKQSTSKSVTLEKTMISQCSEAQTDRCVALLFKLLANS